jgi:hypothetical protein
MGLAAAGSGPAEDGGFLWAIKVCSAHFLRRGSKAVGSMSYIYLQNLSQHESDAFSAKFPDPYFSPVILLLRYQMALAIESG